MILDKDCWGTMKVLPGAQSASTCPTSAYKVSYDTDKGRKVVNEEVVKSATNGQKNKVLTKKKASCTKVQRHRKFAKHTQPEKKGVRRATNA